MLGSLKVEAKQEVSLKNHATLIFNTYVLCIFNKYYYTAALLM